MLRSIFLAILALAPPVGAQVIETEALQLARGRTLATGKEMRVWRFQPLPAPMQGWPTEVRGAFLEVRCEDLEFSEAALVIVRDDFRIRSYPAKLLAAEDRKLADAMEAKRRAAMAAAAAKKPYKANYTPYHPDKDKAVANFSESEHFTFYHGNERDEVAMKGFADPNFIERQKSWFEKTWTQLGELKAPLPMANDPAPKKINIYITGTGLPHHKEGFAYGGESVMIHPAALGAGSSVVIHEFTHSLQFYAGGYRDSPYVGWFWECHANWSSHQYMPAYAPVLAHYVNRAHYELSSTRHNYGSWPFLQVLAEHPKFGSGFPYEIWSESLRDAKGAATEDPFQTIMRVGAKRGIWKDGISGFGDLVGELAARMVAWDFQNEFVYQRDMRNAVRHSQGTPSTRTVLEPVADRAGWHKPIFSHAPRQYGINIIELEPTAGKVEVDFSGVIDETEGSDWRLTLVAYQPHGVPRYSATVRSGKLSMDVRAGEKIALAIAATPTKYTPQEFRPGYNRKPRFPYEVSFTGAKPATAPPAAPQQLGGGAPHPNGGGFVSAGAKVAATAYVGPNAAVMDVAEVSGEARIEDHAVLRQHAKVSDKAIVSGYGRVTENAQLGGRARVGGFARLGGHVSVGENARVLEYATVEGRGNIRGNALIKGFGEVMMQESTVVSGGAIFGEDLEVHFAGLDRPDVDAGMFYGYLNADFIKKDAGNNNWLYPHWTFNQPRGQVVVDSNADCNGVIRGNAKYASEGSRSFLAFDGSSHVLIEGHVAETRDATFDLHLWWDGGEDGQRIFELGDETSSVLLGLTKGGRPAFFIRRDNQSSILQATAPIPTKKWVRLTVSLKDKLARIYIDGLAVGENADFALAPEDVRAASGRIGAGVSGKGFRGRIDDFTIFRHGFASVAELPVLWLEPISMKATSGRWSESDGLFRREDGPNGSAMVSVPGDFADYDLTFKVRKLSGNEGCVVRLRTDAAERRFAQFRIGWRPGTSMTNNDMETWAGPSNGALGDNQWQEVAVVLRGTTAVIKIDGREALKTERVTDWKSGGISLGAQDAKVEIRDILVSSPDGKKLWSPR
jgi:carbonic anhydrase/acetyltransferase-like protein (isoleucine patch superfamily)